jgi:flagellar biosynthesis GTPase FlhF
VSAQRFIGANSRDAMNQVRAALGEDALILSSRMTDDGVEIMAQGEETQAAPPLLEWLLEAGFSNTFSEELLGRGPAQLPDATPARLKAWLMNRLDSHLNQLTHEAELFKAPTVIALVGPTGVGKTTTTAKLAARYVMRHGPDNVALVTTDSFRVGAHEQLNIYAGLLGVELHALGPDASLSPLLNTLTGKRLVIIDTVGMSQRDQRLLNHIQQLSGVRLMLVLNAASHGDTLDEVVHTYRDAAQAAGCRLDDCIISKCDEAARLGPVLETVIRHGLRLNYLSVGQQVPEDLQLPGNSTVLQQAVDISRPSRFAAPPGKATNRHLDALVRGLLGQRKAVFALRDSLITHVEGFALLAQVWPLMAQPQACWDGFLSEPPTPLSATWVTPAKAGHRAVHNTEPHPLGTLAKQAQTFGVRELRYRNRHARMSLSHLPVTFKGAAVRAWFATLQDSHSGQHLGQRYWLVEEQHELNEQAAELLHQVQQDELASLTARGSTLLLDLHPHLHAEPRHYLAAGLAASAVRLTQARDDWAFQARAQLLGLLPKKPRGNAGDILEGLLHLSAVVGSFEHA